MVGGTINIIVEKTDNVRWKISDTYCYPGDPECEVSALVYGDQGATAVSGNMQLADVTKKIAALAYNDGPTDLGSSWNRGEAYPGMSLNSNQQLLGFLGTSDGTLYTAKDGDAIGGFLFTIQDQKR